MGREQRRVVIASRNADKVRELAALMEGLPFEVVPSSEYPDLPDVVEDGITIEGNATRKALVTAAYTGEIAMADDTALQVRELNGLPDVFAARFSGEGATYTSNASLLLEMMQDVPDDCRQARFATACAWIDPRAGELPGTVLAPAVARRLHNPWAGVQEAPPEEFDGLLDREQVWTAYRTALLTDLVSWGHDPDRVGEVAEGLLERSARERQGEPPAGFIRLPDPRIWAKGPDDMAAAPTRMVPAGLPADAPGRSGGEGPLLQITAIGKVLGTVTREFLGTGGFGYDPVFTPAGEARTLAEMEPAEKNRISHRGRALRRLLAAVRQAYGTAG